MAEKYGGEVVVELLATAERRGAVEELAATLGLDPPEPVSAAGD